MPSPASLNIPGPAAAFSRLHDYSGLWCLYEPAAKTLWQAAQNLDLAAHVGEARAVPELRQHRVPVAVGGAGRLSSARAVGVVELSGTLMRHPSSLYDSTSTVEARRVIREMADDPGIAGILLVIDSPGGTASGTDDLARDVAAAALRKPVHAHVDDLAASAAYWVASQATRITAGSRTAAVGSIGTYLVLYDYSGLAAKEGVEAVLISTHELKGAATPGTKITDAQRAEFRRVVDQLQNHFSSGVADGRGLPAEKLDPDAEGTLATGQVWLPEDAIALGLLDAVESFDEALAGVLDAAATFDPESPRSHQPRSTTMSTPTPAPGSNPNPAAAEAAPETPAAPESKPASQTPPPAQPAAETQPNDAAPDNPPAAAADQPAVSESPEAAAANAAPGVAFMAEFGEQQGSLYFARGLTLDQARVEENKRLRAENEKLRDAAAQTKPAPASAAAQPGFAAEPDTHKTSSPFRIRK
ncbi:MAG: S49 family peptidase [Planctomycetota bacterium]